MVLIQSKACRYGAHHACEHVTCQCDHHGRVAVDGDIVIAGHRWPVKNWRVRTVDPFATFAEGQRTVTEHRECEENHRWQGTIDNPGYPGRVWRGWGAGDVIEAMDKDLGVIPEKAYKIVE